MEEVRIRMGTLPCVSFSGFPLRELETPHFLLRDCRLDGIGETPRDKKFRRMGSRKSISTFARRPSRSRGHRVPIFLSGILQCFLLPQGQLAWLTCFNLDLPYEEMKGLSYPLTHFLDVLGIYTGGVEAETAALPSLTPTRHVNKGVCGGRVEYGKESVLGRSTASEKALRLARAGGSEEERVASGARAQGDGWAGSL